MLSAPQEALSYRPEIDFEITGTVHDESGTPLPYARLVMPAGRGREAFAAEDTADAEGHFRFAGHAFPESKRVLLWARNEKGRRYEAIRIEQDAPRNRTRNEAFTTGDAHNRDDNME